MYFEVRETQSDRLPSRTGCPVGLGTSQTGYQSDWAPSRGLELVHPYSSVIKVFKKAFPQWVGGSEKKWVFHPKRNVIKWISYSAFDSSHYALSDALEIQQSKNLTEIWKLGWGWDLRNIQPSQNLESWSDKIFSTKSVDMGSKMYPKNSLLWFIEHSNMFFLKEHVKIQEMIFSFLNRKNLSQIKLSRKMMMKSGKWSYTYSGPKNYPYTSSIFL